MFDAIGIQKRPVAAQITAVRVFVENGKGNGFEKHLLERGLLRDFLLPFLALPNVAHCDAGAWRHAFKEGHFGETQMNGELFSRFVDRPEITFSDYFIHPSCRVHKTLAQHFMSWTYIRRHK